MLVAKELKSTHMQLSSIVDTVQQVKDAYDGLQLFGVLKPNLYKEFYDLQTRLCAFNEALARLIDKTSEE